MSPSRDGSNLENKKSIPKTFSLVKPDITMGDSDRLAKIHHLDDLPQAASIEYPANVQNMQKAIDMVGGRDGIQRSIVDNKEYPLELRLRPNDPFEHPVSARTSKHENILLKVTVPRKFYDQANGDIHKAVQLSQGRYKVRPSHILGSNFRFREITDYQYNTSNSAFVQKFKKTMNSFDFELFKQSEHEGPVEISGTQMDGVPPPRFSLLPYPYLYQYKQNPAVAIVDDGKGGSKLINTAAAKKVQTMHIKWEDPIPMESKESKENIPESVQNSINELAQLFEERPIWTKKALQTRMSTPAYRALRVSLPHVAYNYKSGPFRGSYVKYGIDPKSSSDYAVYQVEHFRLFTGEEERLLRQKKATTSDLCHAPINKSLHVFDGESFPDARVLMFCDVTDPLFYDLIHRADFRTEPHRVYGWYTYEAIDTLKRLLKAKLTCLKEGKPFTQGLKNKIMNYHKDRAARIQGKNGNDDSDSGSDEYNDSYMENPDEEYRPDGRPHVGNDGSSEEIEDEDDQVEEDDEEEEDEDEADGDNVEERAEEIGERIEKSENEGLKGLFGYVQQK